MLGVKIRNLKEFIMAGKAIFTMAIPKIHQTKINHSHYTFKISRKKEQTETGVKYTYFASLLTGPDNQSWESYTYMGIVDFLSGDLILTRNSGFKADSWPVRILRYLLNVAYGLKDLDSRYEVMHEGYCCKCGRLLTTPESIAAGIGPICAEK